MKKFFQNLVWEFKKFSPFNRYFFIQSLILSIAILVVSNKPWDAGIVGISVLFCILLMWSLTASIAASVLFAFLCFAIQFALILFGIVTRATRFGKLIGFLAGKQSQFNLWFFS